MACQRHGGLGRGFLLQPADLLQRGELADVRAGVLEIFLILRGAVLDQDGQALPRRHLHVGADLANGIDQCHGPLHCLQALRIDLLRVAAREGLQHDAFAVKAHSLRNLLPDFLGDEGDDRMQQAQRGLQHLEQHAPRVLLDLGRGIVSKQQRLAELDVPVTQLMPDKVVQGLCGQVEAVACQVLVGQLDRFLQPGEDPAVRQGAVSGIDP